MNSFDQHIITCASECVNAERDTDYTSLKRRYACRTCGCPCDLQADMECRVCSKRPTAEPLRTDEQLAEWARQQGQVVVYCLSKPEWSADDLAKAARRAAHWARLLLIYCEQDRAERRSA